MGMRRLVSLLVLGCLLPSAAPPTYAHQPSLTFATVTAGASHTCALTTAGHAYCWGDNTEGELGTGERVDALSPKPIGRASCRERVCLLV